MPFKIRLLPIAALLSLVNCYPFAGHIQATADGLLPSYDYVIVGGGASGLTVANRLSEDSSKKHIWRKVQIL